MPKAWLHDEIKTTKKTSQTVKVPTPKTASNVSEIIKLEQRVKELEQKEKQAEKELEDYQNVKNREQEKSQQINGLESKSIYLLDKEIDLPELKGKHAELFSLFKNLGLTKTWEYLDEMLQDYFKALELIDEELTGEAGGDMLWQQHKELKRRYQVLLDKIARIQI